MDDDTLNTNLEWKKKSFGKKERLSRRIDARQATLFESSKKNHFHTVNTATSLSLSSNLKKLRKKIKDVFDEEDEDEEEYTPIAQPFMFSEENTLFDSLNDTEKQQLNRKRQNREIKMQQDAGKTAALSAANILAKKAGLKSLSKDVINQSMQNNAWEKDTFTMVMENAVTPNIKLGKQALSKDKLLRLMKGLKRLKKIGGYEAAAGMNVSEFIKITDEKLDDQKVAKLLLNKTGRKVSGRSQMKPPQNKKDRTMSLKKLMQRSNEKKLR